MPPSAPPSSPPSLPPFDPLWNYADPAATEAAFRALLPAAGEAGAAAYEAELLTQIARAEGLQQRFDEAHATLDRVDALLAPGPEMAAARVRSLLERGRVVNSAGDAAGAVPFFEQALDLADAAGQEYHAVDAAHMLGIVCPGEASIAWNERALALAEAAEDPRARGWRGALYNNLGWTYHDLGRHEAALAMFRKHLEVRAEQGNETQIGIALWSIAKTYRLLGRVDEALDLLQQLLPRPERQGNDAEGYTREELGECLLLQGSESEAAPHFARAWTLLHEDPWLRRDEPERLARLRRLGGLATEH